MEPVVSSPGGGRETVYRMVGALDDPLRRQLFDFVASRAPGEVSRDEAAEHAGIRRGQAAFHLDRLVKVGLLEPVFRRLSGRTGPGAGRPAKLYRRTAAPIRITIPERRYQLLAGWLAEAIGRHPDNATVERAGASAAGLARAEGRALVERPGRDASPPAAELVQDALRAFGFVPVPRPDGSVILRNCPFAEVAAANRDVVCTVNLALQRGLLAGIEGSRLEAELDPQPDRCCVVLRPEA